MLIRKRWKEKIGSIGCCRGRFLVTDNTLNVIEYKLYYTDNNNLVGQDEGKDCLEPGEIENVSLRIVFASTAATAWSLV